MMGSAAPAVPPDDGLIHDLLNELMIVIGECGLLSEEVTDSESSLRIRRIRESAARMSERVTRNGRG
jgi:hypothetical protein